MAEVRTTSSTGGQKGTKLARFDLIPVGPLTALAEHYGVGASKYADNQWRKGYEWSKTYAALMRHLTAWWAGFDYDVCSNDPEGCSHVDTEGNPFVAIREDACFNHTGSHHLAAVAWHAFAGLEFVARFPEHDDRYKPETVEVGPTGQATIVDWREPVTMTLEARNVSLETIAVATGVPVEELVRMQQAINQRDHEGSDDLLDALEYQGARPTYPTDLRD